MSLFPSSVNSWPQRIESHSFPKVGDTALTKSYRKITAALDETLAEVLVEKYFDNTPAEFFETLPERVLQNKMKDLFGRYVATADFRDALRRSNGDECLGFGHECLKKMQVRILDVEKLKAVYDVDVDQPIQTETTPCSFATAFSTMEGTAVKISAYLSGFLANSALPYYHFAALVTVQEDGDPNRRMVFVADPGEGMNKLFSHFELRDVGAGKNAQIMSLNERRDLLRTPYFDWVSNDPEAQSLILEHGIYAEGFWRRHQQVVIIDKAQSLQELQKHHNALYSFLLYPKIVKFDAAGDLIACVVWNLLNAQVTLHVAGKTYCVDQEALVELRNHGSFTIEGETIHYQQLLDSWNSVADAGEIDRKIGLMNRYGDQFYCEMVDADFLRTGVREKVDAEVERLATRLSLSRDEVVAQLLDDPARMECKIREGGTASPMLLREINGSWTVPRFVRQILDTAFESALRSVI